MNTASLREFVLSVSACVETTSLIEVWQLFQAGQRQIVVVDARQMPLGVFTLQHWLHFCLLDRVPEVAHLQSGLRDIRTEHTDRFTGDGSSTGMPFDVELFRCVLSPSSTLRLVLEHLDPVVVLPIAWQIDQLQPYFAAIDQPWVLVDAAGQYAGMVDRLRLLQYLAAPTLQHGFSPELGVTSNPDAAKTTHQPSHTAAIRRGSEPPKAPRPSGITTPAIDPLIDLLERIPVPLMLQTGSGRIITQNLGWRQQVSNLQDPTHLGREAAVILESMEWKQPEGSTDSMAHPIAHVHDSAALDLDLLQAGGWQKAKGHSTSRPAGVCRLSNEPNGCVCICPLKNGQERIWKFLKVPMGLTSAQPTDLQAGLTDAEATVDSEHFKLANLGFNPDPDWRSLAQTEFLWLILAHDITEQHQIARELAAKNADLVQLNRLKDEFLSCISHELKTPLTAVLGLSSLLKDQALGKLNERQSRYARLIHQSGRHLISIVNDILDLTRIETGQMELTLEPVRIETICRSAYQQAQQLHAAGNSTDPANSSDAVTRFHLEIRDQLETLVADELRLRQMLCHLLSNALKFTDPAGNIGLRIEKWESWIAFTVWDTGIGIPVDKQHLIFQKFQQLESPMTRQFEGTGLGLVLTQRLARLHGGDITFTSIEGQGSEFTLLLPPSPPQATAEQKEDAKRHAPSPNLITSRNRLMLVVEADPHLIETTSHQILELGYRVAIARTGTEALEKIRRLQPAIVFLNPLLPLLSGWDVLTLLKADEETRHIPVVITATRADRDQASQNGANAFLSLPIRAEALQRCTNRLMEQFTAESSTSAPSLTVLYLNGSTLPSPNASTADIAPVSSHLPASLQDLTSLLHPYQCRVLEVEDLEQADLLAQVWNPNVVLIGGKFADPLVYMQQLVSYPELAALPIVTLTVEITHAANITPGLSVFPCLLSTELSNPSSQEQPSNSALWQVIQMAAGIHWTSHILIADVSALENEWATATPSDLQAQVHYMLNAPRSLNSTQALVHYMQIAGFRSSVGHSWQQVVQQLEHHSVDLLLLCVHSSSNLHPLFLDIIETIEHLNPKPPILVWNCRSDADLASHDDLEQLQRRWGTIATDILPASLSVPDLLTRINQVLTER